MEYRPLDITVISADDLKDVNLMSKMDVYVVVSIAGDSKTTRKTPIHRGGGTSPKWNYRLNLSIGEASLSQQPNLSLLFQIKSDRTLGDKGIGDVSVPIRELLDDNSDDGSNRVVDYQVRTTAGKPKGTLKFSYKFGEKSAAPAEAMKSTKFDEPVTAYPIHCSASTAYALPPGVGYAMPPSGMAAAAPYPLPQGYENYPPPSQNGGYPPTGPGYGYPPPQHGGYPPGGPGYGYPPPQMGYGYPAQQAKPAKKKKGSKFGLGLGAGLLGGLLVGDMISDVGEMAAYDAGFEDAGGFDF